MKDEWDSLCKRLGYKFNDPSILKQALTHKSFLPSVKNENRVNNERLEFLGDAVLDLVVSEMLMQKFPNLEEGGLSKFRASLVSESGLKKQAQSLDLGSFLLIGRGEEITGGREKKSLLADTFEAVIAAIYIDSREKHGIGEVTRVIQNLFLSYLPNDAESHITLDYKSELQEYVQKLFGISSKYELIEEVGPDHEKKFTMAVFIKEIEYGRGQGGTKKIASQLAAEKALKKILKESHFAETKI